MCYVINKLLLIYVRKYKISNKDILNAILIIMKHYHRETLTLNLFILILKVSAHELSGTTPNDQIGISRTKSMVSATGITGIDYLYTDIDIEQKKDSELGDARKRPIDKLSNEFEGF